VIKRDMNLDVTSFFYNHMIMWVYATFTCSN